jgi:hypothetical protein
MLDPKEIGIAAARLAKIARTTRQARAGRRVKGHNITKQLHAAGEPRMDTKGVMAYPRGSRV